MTSFEQTKVVHAAMEEAKGDRDRAAVILAESYPGEFEKLTKDELIHLLRNDPSLHQRWISGGWQEENGLATTPATESDAITRTSPIPLAARPAGLTKDDAVAMQLARADVQFHKGFPAMGFSDAEISFATNLQSWHGKHFRGVVDMVSGGMARASVRVMMLLDLLAARLADRSNFAGDHAVEDENMCWTQFNALCANLVRMSDSSQNGAMIRAKMELFRKQATDGKKTRSSKPGFAPLAAAQIHVNGDAAVNISSTTTNESSAA